MTDAGDKELARIFLDVMVVGGFYLRSEVIQRWIVQSFLLFSACHFPFLLL